MITPPPAVRHRQSCPHSLVSYSKVGGASVHAENDHFEDVYGCSITVLMGGACNIILCQVVRLSYPVRVFTALHVFCVDGRMYDLSSVPRVSQPQK